VSGQVIVTKGVNVVITHISDSYKMAILGKYCLSRYGNLYELDRCSASHERQTINLVHLVVDWLARLHCWRS